MTSNKRITLFKDDLMVLFDDKKGLLSFSPENDDLVEIWGNRIYGDKILLIEDDLVSDYINIYSLKVVNKSVTTDYKSPLQIYVDIVGETSFYDLEFDVKNDVIINFNRVKFEDYWGQSVSDSRSVKPYLSKNEPIYLYERDGYKIYVAYRREDKDFIKKISSFHSFGYSPCFLQMIAMYNNNKVGAIGVKYSSQVKNKDLQRRKRLFKQELKYVKNNSLLISRLYSKPKKFKIHYHLIKSLEQLSKGLVTQPEYSVIEGVSYDFHPVARLLNYNILAPTYVNGAYYYYKNIFKHQRRTPNIEYKEVRRIHELRKNKNYWILYGRHDLILKSFQINAWGLKDGEELYVNRGAWHVMKEGDVVFLCERKTRNLFGIQYVKNKRLKKDGGIYKNYPLWIEFKEAKRIRTPFAIAEKYFIQNRGISSLEQKKGTKWEDRILNETL